MTDAVTCRPVAGLWLFDWKQKDVDGRSDDCGEVAIPDMPPEEFRFAVESATHARWWPDQATREWERKAVDDPRTG